MTTQEIIYTLANLSAGSVINYNNPIIADNADFVIISHYEDFYGKWTRCLNKEDNSIQDFMQHTQLKGLWSIVKEN